MTFDKFELQMLASHFSLFSTMGCSRWFS